MLITATIPKQRAVGAVVVPLGAIAQTQSGNAVFIVRNGAAKQILVKVGLQTDTLAQVISPQVVPGSVVITTRPDALQDGSKVAVNGAAAPASTVKPGKQGAQ